ncbi:hypothetical protein [Photobacterium damselae]|uniref:hypothetical protein n=1 Tax=Photobacterium damselae TaxID=38293 RepID=UPI001F2447DB|nr:hypothetical protein [Photobacterium damselae]UKA04802.1 hypothetical protein IHC89_21405 [Photobacterium damselae subsp. damselae]
MSEYKPLFEYDQKPMSKTVSKALLDMIMVERAQRGVSNGVLETMSKFPLYNILASQLSGYDIFEKVTDRTKVFLTVLINETNATPAVCRLWAHTLKTMICTHNCGVVDTRALINFFPSGFPDKAGLDQAWDDYKVAMKIN